MTKPSMQNLEADLWEAADQLRANSKLTANEYSQPVLGLIFLRHAYNRFLMIKAEIEPTLPLRGGVRAPLQASHFQGKAAIFLPEKSQYSYLVNLPENQGIAVTGGTNMGPEIALRILVVPVLSGQWAILTAVNYDAIILRLPEGNQTFFGFLNGSLASLAYFDTFHLPDQLPVDTRMVFGVQIDLTKDSLAVSNITGKTAISFVVPVGYDPNDLMIAFWNPDTKVWEEILSVYTPFLQVQKIDCLYMNSTDPQVQECLFTQWNHSGNLGRIFAEISRPGQYALLVKGKQVELQCNNDQVAVALANGITLSVPCGGVGSIVAIPEAVWNLQPVSESNHAVSAFTFYEKSLNDAKTTLSAGEKATISFALPEGIAADQVKIVFWVESTQSWIDVADLTLSGNSIQAVVDQIGTYELVTK